MKTTPLLRTTAALLAVRLSCAAFFFPGAVPGSEKPGPPLLFLTAEASETEDAGDSFTTEEDAEPEEYTWPVEGISTRIPTPAFPLEDLWTNAEFPDQFLANFTTSFAVFQTYKDACKEQGFCLEETDSCFQGEDSVNDNFQVFDAEGYRLQLRFNGTPETGRMEIALHAPVRLGTLQWPEEGPGLLLPLPPTTEGSVGGMPQMFLIVYLGNMPIDAYQSYVEDCIAAGFDQSIRRTDSTFSAADQDGIKLEISYNGGGIVFLRIVDPEQKWIARTQGLPAENGEENGEEGGVPLPGGEEDAARPKEEGDLPGGAPDSPGGSPDPGLPAEESTLPGSPGEAGLPAAQDTLPGSPGEAGLPVEEGTLSGSPGEAGLPTEESTLPGSPGEPGLPVEEGTLSGSPGEAGLPVEEGTLSGSPGEAGLPVEEDTLPGSPGEPGLSGGTAEQDESRLPSEEKKETAAPEYDYRSAEGMEDPSDAGGIKPVSDTETVPAEPETVLSSPSAAGPGFEAGDTDILPDRTEDPSVLIDDPDSPSPVQEVNRTNSLHSLQASGSLLAEKPQPQRLEAETALSDPLTADNAVRNPDSDEESTSKNRNGSKSVLTGPALQAAAPDRRGAYLILPSMPQDSRMAAQRETAGKEGSPQNPGGLSSEEKSSAPGSGSRSRAAAAVTMILAAMTVLAGALYRRRSFVRSLREKI